MNDQFTFVLVVNRILKDQLDRKNKSVLSDNLIM